MTDPSMTGKPKYERIDKDAYFTPDWCTEALLSRWLPVGAVWEPAAGSCAIVRVLERSGVTVVGSDIQSYGNDWAIGDFLTGMTPSLPGVFSIVTNPPYNLAEQFIRRSLVLTRHCGRVAMLLRHEFDCASSRRDLFQDGPRFKRKIVLTKRPRWIADSTGSPRHNYAWYIWDAQHRGPATLEYAP